ncbi:MAG: RAD55 family ATPase [Halobacteriales archaeon]
MYHVAPLLPLDSVTPGTNLLLRGPPMTQKHRLAYALLAEGHRHGESGILVSADEAAARLRSDILPDRIDHRRLAIVDCVTHQQGQSATDDDSTRYVGSPADLTGIGMHVTELIESIQPEGTGQYRLVIDSISTMLAYAPAEKLFRFFHVLTARLSNSNGLGVYVAHTESGSDEELRQLTSLFDGIVDTRRTDDALELRVRGLTAEPTDWSQLDLPTETPTDAMASTGESP